MSQCSASVWKLTAEKSRVNSDTLSQLLSAVKEVFVRSESRGGFLFFTTSVHQGQHCCISGGNVTEAVAMFPSLQTRIRLASDKVWIWVRSDSDLIQTCFRQDSDNIQTRFRKRFSLGLYLV